MKQNKKQKKKKRNTKNKNKNKNKTNIKYKLKTIKNILIKFLVWERHIRIISVGSAFGVS